MPIAVLEGIFGALIGNKSWHWKHAFKLSIYEHPRSMYAKIAERWCKENILNYHRESQSALFLRVYDTMFHFSLAAKFYCQRQDGKKGRLDDSLLSKICMSSLGTKRLECYTYWRSETERKQWSFSPEMGGKKSLNRWSLENSQTIETEQEKD